MSRPPSRLETKSSRRPSGSQTGLRLSAFPAATWTGAPPSAGTTMIALGAMLPSCERPTVDVRGVAGDVRDPAAVGRPRRRVGLGTSHQQPWRAAIRRPDEERVGPPVDEPAAIGRPGEVARGVGRRRRDQQLGHAAERGHDLDPARRLEGNARAVRRPLGPPEIALDVSRERHGAAAVELPDHDLPVAPGSGAVGDQLAVRREGGVELEARVARHLRAAAEDQLGRVTAGEHEAGSGED